MYIVACTTPVQNPQYLGHCLFLEPAGALFRVPGAVGCNDHDSAIHTLVPGRTRNRLPEVNMIEKGFDK